MFIEIENCNSNKMLLNTQRIDSIEDQSVACGDGNFNHLTIIYVSNGNLISTYMPYSEAVKKVMESEASDA